MALEPLGSDHFFETMARLKEAGADELYAIKAERWMDQAANLLEVPNGEVTIGYADKLTDNVERLNFPMVAKIHSGVAESLVQEYMQDLVALPTVQKDSDYRTLTSGLMRSAHMFHEVKTRFPGLAPSWQKFFDDRRKTVFELFPEMIDESEPERKLLFEALASVVSGDVPASLEKYREDLERASEQFYDGRSQELADSLFGISAQILDVDPPQPPGAQPPPGSKNPCTGGAGGSGGSPSEPGEDDDEDEHENEGDDEQDEQDEQDGQDKDDKDGPDQDDEDPDEDPQDPLEQLGAFLQRTEPDTAAPKNLNAEMWTKTPPPKEVDLDKVEELKELAADLVFPEADTEDGYVTFNTMRPPGAQLAYAANVRVLSRQIARLRQIVEEYYRTSTITETGLKSGSIDPARMIRANFGVTNVFKRHTVDSVGHAEVVVLLDESGSMGAHINAEGIEPPSYAKLPGVHTGSTDQAFLGRAIPSPGNSRAMVAMRMALMLLEVSRQLSGFHVTVAGYSTVGSSNLGPMFDLAKAANARTSYYNSVPVVRLLGTTEQPYPVITTVPMQENADYQALHWAVERLKKSSATQRALLYLADGQIWEDSNNFEKLLGKSQRMGITPFFMNLAGYQPNSDSMLMRIDRKDVVCFQDMLDGLKQFLRKMVANAR